MSVTKRTRYEVFRRDGHTCRYCGQTPPDVKLTVDHVKPTALGGTDDPENLVTACQDCNAGKSSMPADAPLVADVKQDALRWAAAIKEAQAIQAAKKDAADALFRQFLDAWACRDSDLNDLSASADSTVEQFLSSGLTIEEICEAVDIAWTSRVFHTKVWRYFCGVCWRKIRDLHDVAAALLEPEMEQ